jgi:hypothetical protein
MMDWNNKEQVIKYIKTNYNPDAEQINPDLWKDREVVLAWAPNYNSLHDEGYLEPFKGDKEIILTAVSNDSRALQYASEELKADKEFVLAAISQDGRALEYASPELKNDKEVVLAAISNDSRALQYASKSLQKDNEVRLQIGWDKKIEELKDKPYDFKFVNKAIQGDKEVVIDLMKDNPNYVSFIFEHASPALQNDKEVVLAAISQDDRAIQFASDEIEKLVGDSSDPAAKLQSLIEKEALEAKMAARGITFNQEGRGKDLGFAL